MILVYTKNESRSVITSRLTNCYCYNGFQMSSYEMSNHMDVVSWMVNQYHLRRHAEKQLTILFGTLDLSERKINHTNFFTI